MTFTDKFVCMAHHFILLRLNPIWLRVDSEGFYDMILWFYSIRVDSLTWLQVFLSGQGGKNVFWHWLSPLIRAGSQTMTFTGKFVYMAHHFILLRLNPLDLKVEREGWWFDHSISWLWVSLSEEGTKNVSWPWLLPLWWWGSLTTTFTGKFVYMAHRFILLLLNPFCLRVDRKGWWFQYSIRWLQISLSLDDAKNVSRSCVSQLQGWSSLIMTFTFKFVHMAYHFILLRLNPFGLRVDREGWWFEHSMSWLRVRLSAEGAKNVLWPWLSPLWGWSSLTMTFSRQFVYMGQHFILLQLNVFGLRVDGEGWWFEHSMSWLRICLSAERAKNVFWPWLYPFGGSGSLTMTFTGKFVYMPHNFILLLHNPFGLRDDREGSRCEHSTSCFRVCLSAEGAQNICRLLLSLLWRWSSLTITFTAKFVYLAHHFILLQLNPFGYRVEMGGWWFVNSMWWSRVCLSAVGAKNVSWPCLYPLRGLGSLTIIFTGKFVYMAHNCILLRHNPFGLREEREEWWFDHSMLWLWVCLLAEGAKNLCWHWLSPLRGWESLTMTFTGKFVYMTRDFILRRLNPFGLRVDREGWWFEDCLLWLWVFLSAEGAKNVS